MFFMHGIHMYFTMFFLLGSHESYLWKIKIIFRLNRCMFLAHPRFVQGRLRGWWWHSRRPEDRPKMAGMGRMGCIKPSGKPWETQFKADVFLNEQFHQSNFRLIYIYIYIQYITTVYIYSIHLQYIYIYSLIVRSLHDQSVGGPFLQQSIFIKPCQPRMHTATPGWLSRRVLD